MQRCEPRSLLSAACTNSSLRKAAVAALPSLTLDIKCQRQLDSLQCYLAAHSQHVRHLDLQGSSSADSLKDVQLPQGVALESLTLRDLPLSLHLASNAHGLTGVLTGQSRLTRLVMHGCEVPAGEGGLAAALQQLPSLQHLDIVAPMEPMPQPGLLCLHGVYNLYDEFSDDINPITFTGEVLQHLRGLTFLQLSQGAVGGSSVLQHLSALTALRDLQIYDDRVGEVDPEEYATLIFEPDTLAALCRLTSLRLECGVATVQMDPAALAGKPHMQHLQLPFVHFMVDEDDRPGTAALLSVVREMQELSHLDLLSACHDPPETAPPATAYTALKSSSRLQYLDFSSNFLPAGVWQQLFGPGKQMQQLQVLDISRTNFRSDPDLSFTTADASCLASCCPGLQQLTAYGTLRDAAAVTALRSLSSLTCLLIGGFGMDWATLRGSERLSWAGALALLTQLVELDVRPEGAQWGQGLEVDLLQLTPLERLTRLEVWDSSHISRVFECKAPINEPVSDQLKQLLEDLPHCSGTAL